MTRKAKRSSAANPDGSGLPGSVFGRPALATRGAAPRAKATRAPSPRSLAAVLALLTLLAALALAPAAQATPTHTALPGLSHGPATGTGDLESTSKEVKNVVTSTGAFQVGQTVTSTVVGAIPASTEITAVGIGTLELSNAATATAPAAPLSATSYLGKPCGVATDSAGDLYVGEPNAFFSSKVLIYGPAGGAPVRKVPAATPCNVAVDSNGVIYTNNNGVKKFTPTTPPPVTGGTAYTGETAFPGPTGVAGIAVDPSDQSLYAVENGNETQTLTLTGFLSGDTFTLTCPNGETTGSITVSTASTTRGAIKTALEAKCGAGNFGTVSGSYVIPFQGAFAGLNVPPMTCTPVSVATPPASCAITAETSGFSRIGHYESGGTVLSKTIGTGVGSGLTAAVYYGVDVYGANHDVYTTDVAHNKAYILSHTDPTGATGRKEFDGSGSAACTQGAFTGMVKANLAVDQSNGNVLVSDVKGHGVVDEFNAAGKCLLTIAHSPAFAEAEPTDIAVDSSSTANRGDVYISSGNTATTANVYAYGALTPKITLTPTVTPGGSGEVKCNGAPCAPEYAEESSIELKAEPIGVQVFKKWKAASGSAAPCENSTNPVCTVELATASAITAEFGPLGFNLKIEKAGSGSGTVTSSPAGTNLGTINCGTGPACEETYPPLAVVTLTATATGGSEFAGWTTLEGTPTTTCAATTSPCEVTMSEAVKFKATFNDTAAPDTVIDTGPTGSTNDSTPTFEFHSTEAGSSFECKVDAAAFASCTSPFTTAVLADGSHTVQFRAIDAATNVDPTPASRTFTVDTAAPDTVIDTGPTGSTNDSTPTFEFHSTEAGSSFECKVDAGSFAPCTSPFTTAVLADGSHTVQFRAIDAATNVDPTPASRTFTVDTAAPDTVIDTGPTGSTNDSTPTFEFHSTEAGSSFECKVDAAAFASCTSPFTTAVLADGSHTVQFRAIDAATNVDPTPASRTFTVDTAAPDTVIDTGPTGSTNDSTPTFEFHSTEAGSSFECKVDAAAFASCTSPFTTAVLADGSHTVQFRAIDAATNVDPTPASRTFTVDTAAPDTVIDTGPTGSTNDSTPTFEFHSTEAGSSFECKVDAAAFASCTSPFTTAVLADGSHTVQFRAIDAATNVDPTPASRTFTVDTAAPDTVIDTGPTGSTNDSTPTFEFHSTEAGSSFECKVDAAAFASCTSPFTTAVLADGSHTVQFRAIDAATNVDPTPASRTFTVDTSLPDTEPPDTVIDTGPTGSTNDSTPTFEFHSTEAGSSFECKVDAAAFAPCTSPFTTAVLADGSHTVQFRAIDAATNVDPTPASRTFTVDTAAPDTVIDTGPTGSTNDSTPTFEFHSTEAGSSFECKVDAGSFAPCTSPFTTAVLADGSHTVQFRAIDAATNVDPTPASRTFTVDTAAPDTVIDTGPTGSTNDSTPTFEFHSTEAGSSFECKVDAAAFASCTSPFTTAVLADGSHTVQFRAIDAATNVDPTPASRTFTVDTAAPDTVIDTGPTGSTNDSTPTFEFHSTEAGSSFECKVDAAAFASCTSPFTTAVLADGSHTVQFRAIDAATNVDPTPASRTFTVDTAAPDTVIDTGPTGSTNDSTPTFEFHSTEAGSSFECKVDAAAFAPCTSPFTTAVLADGSHTVQFRAIDAATNVDPTPASRTFTVDTAAPDTVIDTGPTGSTNDSTPTFEFHSTEAGSSFECKVDAGSFAPCTSPFTTAVLADGSHTVQFRAIDAATNVDPTPASRTFTVDTAAPDTVIDTGPTGSTNDSTPTFEFHSTEAGSSFECKVDAGSFAPCTSPFTTAVLADGSHTVQFRAIDAATNVDPTPASRTFTVDTAAPDTVIDTGPTGSTNDSTPTFEFHSTEAGSSFECKVDAGSFAPCTSPFTTAVLADGSHTVQVKATDAAGNPDPTPASQGFTVVTTHTINVTIVGTGSVECKDEGAISFGSCAGGFNVGHTVKLKETPGTAFVFSGWSEFAGSGTVTTPCTGVVTECEVKVDNNVTGKATFTAIPLPAITNVVPSKGPTKGGTVVTITGSNFKEASSVKFGPNNAAGFSVNAAGTEIEATSPVGSAGAVNVRVTTPGGLSPAVVADQFTYVSPHTLTVTKAGTGTGSVTCDGGACAVAYAYGSEVTLTATAASGSSFAGFSGGGCSGTGACIVTIEADTTVTATFNANPVEGPVKTCANTPSLCSPPPSNLVTVVSAKPQGSKVALKLTVPGPGSLTATGKKILTAKGTATGAGAFTLKLKLTGAGKKQLNRKGKLKVKVTITFTPTGGTPGTTTKTVTFKSKGAK